MENASKALIIAGAVLVSIMVISLGVALYTRMSGSSKQMANMDKQEISNFNSKITPYLGAYISGSQVNALLQYCFSSNLSNKVSSSKDTKAITVTGEAIITPGKTTTTCPKVDTGGITYSVIAEYNNGLINKIKITKNKT